MLAELTDDYVGLWEVARLVGREWDLEDNAEIRATAMMLISDPVEDGLLMPGMARDDGGFDAWTLAPEEAVDEIRRGWEAINGMPALGDVAWFAITPEGERFVRERSAGHR